MKVKREKREMEKRKDFHRRRQMKKAEAMARGRLFMAQASR